VWGNTATADAAGRRSDAVQGYHCAVVRTVEMWHKENSSSVDGGFLDAFSKVRKGAVTGQDYLEFHT
jgi:hypothetical protein